MWPRMGLVVGPCAARRRWEALLARRGTGGPMDVGSEVLEVDTEVLVAHMGSMEVGSRFKEWELRS